MKKIQPLICLTIMGMISLLLPMIAMAQIDPPPNPDAPIDGGLSILIAAGVGYGVKKVRDGRKKKQDNEMM